MEQELRAMDKGLWFKVLKGKEYKIARSAWGFFLKAHGNECDMDGAIDIIAEGVLEIAKRIEAETAPMRLI